uniref:Uncharacterized protein n=1 Tax=Rhizophora mucronata TaxID=61149 RepID=A0A2P2IUG5_RHIMU
MFPVGADMSSTSTKWAMSDY